MKYKVGDKVLLRDDLVEFQTYGDDEFVPSMLKGQVVTIISFNDEGIGYIMEEDNNYYKFNYTDEMIVRLAE